MTIEGISNTFDTLVNSYAREAMFGQQSSVYDFTFDEYEKSVFLTQAQDIVLKEAVKGYEANELLRRELNPLVKQHNYTSSDAESTSYSLDGDGFVHSVFTLEDDCYYIVFERVKFNSNDSCVNEHYADVVPATHDEYERLRKNPFRGPNIRRALRLDIGSTKDIISNKIENKIEIISNYNINEYIQRYLIKPKPIILVSLQGDLDIEGLQDKSESIELPEMLHRELIETAVKLGIQAKSLSLGNKQS